MQLHVQTRQAIACIMFTVLETFVHRNNHACMYKSSLRIITDESDVDVGQPID